MLGGGGEATVDGGWSVHTGLNDHLQSQPHTPAISDRAATRQAQGTDGVWTDEGGPYDAIIQYYR